MVPLHAALLLLAACWLPPACTQDTCEGDGDCAGDDNCCSSFGFCGMGDGFCSPSTRVGGRGTLERQTQTEVDSGRGAGRGGVSRAGAGCVLQDTELVGGDIPAILGGGGINLDNARQTADGCFRRCEDNPACRWYTWDDREDLCYLKSGRGYLRNRTDDFTSGATFRDGCNRDPYCAAPYSVYRHQCLFFSRQGGLGQRWTPSLADARRNANHSRELCKELGGFLPYNYDGYTDSLSAGLGPGGSRLGDSWTWTGFPGEGGNCYACRPGRRGEGVRSLPCSTNLDFACENRRTFPLPVPARPRLWTAPVALAPAPALAPVAPCLGCRRRYRGLLGAGGYRARGRRRGLHARRLPRDWALGTSGRNPYLG